jgi:hypothetical protein
MSVRTDQINLNVNINGNKAQAELNNLRKRAGDVKFEMQGLKKGTEEYIAKKKELDSVNAEMLKLKQTIGITALTQRELTAEIARMKALRGNVAPLGAEYKKLSTDIAAAEARLQEIKTATSGFTNVNHSAAESFKNIFVRVAEYTGAFELIRSFTSGIKDFFKSSVEEADAAIEAVDGLKVALDNAGRSDLLQPLLNQADEFAAKYKRLDNDDVTGVFTKLVDYGKLTQKQIGDITEVIINYAAKQRISLAESTDIFTKALEGSAKGLKTYGISLADAGTVTDRYNIIVDQLGQKVRGAEAAFEETPKGIREKFMQAIRDAQETVGKFLYSLVGLEDQQFKNAVAARKEADEAQTLVSRYEELSKKTNKTAADKRELETITATLASTFGDSVVEINKETGALQLNVAATKDLITQKLLLASDAAATEANKYRAALQSQKDAQDETTKSLAVLNTKQKEYGITAEEAGKK